MAQKAQFHRLVQSAYQQGALTPLEAWELDRYLILQLKATREVLNLMHWANWVNLNPEILPLLLPQ